MHSLVIVCLLAASYQLIRVEAFLFGTKESVLPVPGEFLFEKSCKTVLNDGGCKCIVHTKDTKCCCVGANITEIPKNFAPTLTMLFLHKTEIKTIESNAFDNYTKLQEIFIDAAKSFTEINANAFGELKNLRKIHITNCPSLNAINGQMLKNNLKIQTVIVRSTGLSWLPRLEMTKQHLLTMEVLDFSHNKIDHIGRDALKNVSAKSVILSHNIIKSIKEYAFDGSRFISLYLNDNKQLSSISPLAFVNILEIKQLNLSNTEISVLPEQGLKNVKHIILRNVPNLKRLPSVLAFNNLNKAEFTYPYHCCFFKYVSREFAKGQSSQYDENYKEIQQRVCQRTEGDINFGRIRKKRNSAKTTTPFSSGFGWLDIDSWLDNKDMPVDGSDESDEEQAYTDLEVGQTEVISKFQECKSSAVDEFYMNISCSPQPDNLNPCEDIVGYTFLRPVIHVMWVMAIVGNIFVWGIIASVWTRRMRLHYFFMFNLAAGDFLTGCYLALLGIKDYSTRDEYYNYAVEWQTGWGCTIAGFISVFASQLSIMSMLIIAGEVYYNSKYGFYGKRMTPKLGYILMSIGYSYALLMATLPLFGVSSYQKTSVCLPLAITSGVDRMYLFIGLSISAFAFVGMIINYIMINVMIRNPDMPSRGEDRQILIRTLVLITADMLCWVPTLFFGLTAVGGYPLISLTNAKICLVLFYPINSCANPWLYVFLTRISRDLKKKAVPMLKHMSFIGETHNAVKNYFYSIGPGEQDPLHHDQDSQKFLQVTQNTQMTSLCSSPRSSSSSQCTTKHSDSTHDLLNSAKDNHQLHTWHNLPTRSQNASEQESCKSIFMEVPQKVHKHRSRVSSPPEMSDISENSSNSNEDGDKKREHFRRGRFVLERNPSSTPPTQRRRASVGRDSGTGDSLLSNMIGKTPSSTSSLEAGVSSTNSTPPETINPKVSLNKKDVRVVFNLEVQEVVQDDESSENINEEIETTTNDINPICVDVNTPLTVQIDENDGV